MASFALKKLRDNRFFYTQLVALVGLLTGVLRLAFLIGSHFLPIFTVECKIVATKEFISRFRDITFSTPFMVIYYLVVVAQIISAVVLLIGIAKKKKALFCPMLTQIVAEGLVALVFVVFWAGFFPASVFPESYVNKGTLLVGLSVYSVWVVVALIVSAPILLHYFFLFMIVFDAQSFTDETIQILGLAEIVTAKEEGKVHYRPAADEEDNQIVIERPSTSTKPIESV